jgi:amino acid transporter/nucleotide-binding universal stress UspA family protein
MLAMSLLLVAVGWAYSVICRLHPEGGGVYSAARERSQSLAVIGALLLCADYIVTASLSALDAFHYLHLPNAHLWAAAAMAFIGVINFFGPTKAGTGALIVAVLTIIFSLTIALFATPHLEIAEFTHPEGTPIDWWRQFTAIILAISGVEAVANMTGIMVEPVPRTSKLAIWPVLVEIVSLNMLLSLAMLAMPETIIGTGGPEGTTETVRDTMLRILAEYYVGPTFAAVAAIVFALLLLSAVNTAVADLVSIQFMMARDNELPSLFGTLNRWGMPELPLIVGTVAPIIIVLMAPDIAALADLYAIGFVGAVSLNLAATGTNPHAALTSFERIAMTGLAVLMAFIWLTIAYEKPHALIFATTVMGLGMAGRALARQRTTIRKWAEKTVPALVEVTGVASVRLAASAAALLGKTATVRSDSIHNRIMVASRGNAKLLNFAVEQAQAFRAELIVLFVRHVAVTSYLPHNQVTLADDAEAMELFREFRSKAEEADIPAFFVYSSAFDVAEVILETAATQAVDTLILGTSQRGRLWRAMKGDIIQQVALHLPPRITLLVHGG